MNQPRGPQKQPEPRGKPGAMTMAMQAVAARPVGPKVLRVGVIQAGKIIEERIIRKRETVSVGSSEKNHFIVQAPGLPSRFDLFQLVGNDYILNFTADMGGRVGLPSGVHPLDQLRSSGMARNAGNYFQVKLTDSSKGKIVVGDVTLLFQFVTPPPVMPRPQLPAAARGGFVKSIDWLFTAFIVFSYMTFFGFIIYLENADWPIEQGIAEIPPQLARWFEDVPPPPEETPPEEGEAEEAEEAEDAPKEAPKEAAPSEGQASNDPAVSAEARARIAQEAAAQAEAMLLTAFGEDGAFADVLAGGAVTGNAEDVLAQASGVGVASGSAADLRAREGGGGSGRAGGLGGLARAGGAGATKSRTVTKVVERVIRGRTSLGSGGDIGGSGDFDSSQVSAAIKRRLNGIKRCYEMQLKSNPTLAGKVSVQFTIEERGNVTGARATENSTGSPAVADCVVGIIKRLRFNPGPEGGSVQYSYPFVFAPQN